MLKHTSNNIIMRQKFQNIFIINIYHLYHFYLITEKEENILSFQYKSEDFQIYLLKRTKEIFIPWPSIINYS